MTLSLSTRIAAAKRMVRRIEEDRPLLLKRLADYSEAEQKLALKCFDDGLESAKRKLEVLLAEGEER